MNIDEAGTPNSDTDDIVVLQQKVVAEEEVVGNENVVMPAGTAERGDNVPEAPIQDTFDFDDFNDVPGLEDFQEFWGENMTDDEGDVTDDVVPEGGESAPGTSTAIVPVPDNDPDDDYDLYSEFDPELESKAMEAIFVVGAVFRSAFSFKLMLHQYSMKLRFNFKWISNKPRRYCVECTHMDCKWRVTASGLGKGGRGEAVCIRKIGVHSHTMNDYLTFKPKVISKYVGGMYMPRIKGDKSRWEPWRIYDELKTYFGVKLNYKQVWKAHEEAIKMIQGDVRDGYSHVPMMCTILKEAIPGSTVDYRVGEFWKG